MEIPTNLKHKPVITVENYSQIDGRNAYDTDAQGLSLGLAQWNERGRVDISAKVWRHTGGKWSRQSEELPLHRVLDLAILACRTQLYMQETAYRFPRGYDPEHTCIDRVGLQGVPGFGALVKEPHRRGPSALPGRPRPGRRAVGRTDDPAGPHSGRAGVPGMNKQARPSGATCQGPGCLLAAGLTRP